MWLRCDHCFFNVTPLADLANIYTSHGFSFLHILCVSLCFTIPFYCPSCASCMHPMFFVGLHYEIIWGLLYTSTFSTSLGSLMIPSFRVQTLALSWTCLGFLLVVPWNYQCIDLVIFSFHLLECYGGVLLSVCWVILSTLLAPLFEFLHVAMYIYALRPQMSVILEARV